ncbi:hypothetical protein BLNAU_22859 [Blattamonas nauphoetae]|uniref:Uncharacterized protein n=1 Tax=Blattamonas nauphoetae TaxID=2049346 RepID=A0ABQ9WRW4_9EUKA|nr:hypothetical protein BLNAU_22859 [Blattamonas nauphoetae]
MDEYRQFSLQKSFGGRGSEWGGASSGGRGGHLTNLFACFPLSIPPHADAQKTNDMAFPPSTRLKMYKEEVGHVSVVQYVCVITDLLLKDDMVTFDDTTRSGSVSPYSEALHIISRCLLTPSPVTRSAVFILLLSLFRADKVRKVGEMYQTCMVESGLVHFTLSALRFGVTAEHCAFLKYFVVVENAWASAVTKAECSYVDPDQVITFSFGSNKEFKAFFKSHGTSSFVPFISKCLPPNLLSTLFVCSPKAPSSDPLIHLSPLPFPSTYVPPSPIATLNATTDILLDSFFAKWEANQFCTFIHTTHPVIFDSVRINTHDPLLALLNQIRVMSFIFLLRSSFTDSCVVYSFQKRNNVSF